MPAASPLGVLLLVAQVGVGVQLSRSVPRIGHVRRVAIGLAVTLLGALALLRFGVLAALAVDLVALAASVTVADRVGPRTARGR